MIGSPPKRSTKEVVWPEVCMGCGYIIPGKPKEYNFYETKYKTVATSWSLGGTTEYYESYSVQVRAFLCETCYKKQRRNFILRVSLIYTIPFIILFSYLDVKIFLVGNYQALPTFLIATVIVFSLYAGIAFWHYKRVYNPADFLIKIKVRNKKIYLKFKSSNFALAFKKLNPSLNVLISPNAPRVYVPSPQASTGSTIEIARRFGTLSLDSSRRQTPLAEESQKVEITPKEVQGNPDCDLCKGSGICNTCKGKGKIRDNEICEICDGSGTCFCRA